MEVENYAFLDKILGPRVCSEFYPGWFVTWGQKSGYPHHSNFIDNIDYMYYHWNASFSIYMIHGGTNFGFQNGEESTNGVGFTENNKVFCRSLLRMIIMLRLVKMVKFDRLTWIYDRSYKIYQVGKTHPNLSQLTTRRFIVLHPYFLERQIMVKFQ